MARWLLIEIDDNDAAEQYIKSLSEGKSFITVPSGESYTVREVSARVVGLFGKPTKFCECPEQDQKAGSTKGAKTDWRVCPNCHLALRGSQTPKNLLDEPGTKAPDKPFYLMARNLG